MRYLGVLALAAAAGYAVARFLLTSAPAAPPAAANVARYHGCPVFTPGDWYNRPVTRLRADPHSAEYIAWMYRSGDTDGFVVYVTNPPAYRVNLATNRTPVYTVHAPLFHQNEFRNPVPWQDDFYIEPQGDGHAIVLNTDTCVLTEMYQAKFADGTLSAYSGWTWNLRSPLTRPTDFQPSATASGLPLLAGLLKGEEIEAASPIDHALNFAPPEGSISPSAYVAPANTTGGCHGCRGPAAWAMPYGAHLRLRAGFQLRCAQMCPQAERIAQALKTYGAYISDTGSPGTGNQLAVAMDASGGNPWNAADLAALRQIRITDMEVLPLGVQRRR